MKPGAGTDCGLWLQGSHAGISLQRRGAAESEPPWVRWGGLESLQWVPDRTGGERGLSRQAFACVGQRVAHCPCLHPLLAALSLPVSPPHCLGAPAGTATFPPVRPGRPGGAEPPAAPAPKPTRGRSPARSSECRPAAAVPGGWLPPAGTQLRQRLARRSRAGRSRLPATAKRWWFARPRRPPGCKGVRCLGCLVLRSRGALTCLAPPQRPPTFSFPFLPRRLLTAAGGSRQPRLGTRGPKGPTPTAALQEGTWGRLRSSLKAKASREGTP